MIIVKRIITDDDLYYVEMIIETPQVCVNQAFYLQPPHIQNACKVIDSYLSNTVKIQTTSFGFYAGERRNACCLTLCSSPQGGRQLMIDVDLNSNFNHSEFFRKEGYYNCKFPLYTNRWALAEFRNDFLSLIDKGDGAIARLKDS